MAYFVKFYDKLNVNAKDVRNCQRGAFYAALAHFSRSYHPCLIGLPTGAGKTALMMMLAFGLKAQRVLIITPAEILRLQTSEKFKKMDDLKIAKAISKNLESPQVLNNEHEFQSIGDWNKCKSFDVVIATPKTTSPKEKRVCEPPRDLFDLVLIDEGHHAPASTWTALIDTFQSHRAKIIMLTGTPYRRDRIEIKADLIYDYPIDRAIEDNIFAPVSFIDVGKSSDDRDRKLAQKGVDIWRNAVKEFSERPLMLIKTDKIEHADKLCDIYKGIGANVKAIHSKRPDKENLKTLDALKSGLLDGIVAVGMVGEGLDVPSLKVGIFHRNPQSLPHTLQVIGRLARANSDISQGQIVGYSDDFSRETFKLYDSSPDWFKLIPELEKKLISGRVGISEDEPLGMGQNFIYDSDLNPYFSVTVHEFLGTPFTADLDVIKEWKKEGHNLLVYTERVSLYEKDTVVVITRTTKQPDWLQSGGFSRLIQESFDLHLFFQRKQLLIEYSSASELSGLIRKEVFGDSIKTVGKERLNRALQAGDGSYVMIGLRKSGAVSQANPSYKMLMGTESQTTVTNSDTKSFHTGHCLMRLKRTKRDSEIRGIAYKKGRIWALRRKNLKNFRSWCVEIADSLLEEVTAELPGLERLRQTEDLKVFPDKPLAVTANTTLITKRVEFVTANGDRLYPHIPDVNIVSFTKSKIMCEMKELDITFAIAIEGKSITYNQVNGTDFTVEIDPVDGVIRRYSMNEFWNTFPPTLIFPDGSIFIDGLYSKPIYIPTLDSDVVRPIDWPDCDINSETKDTDLGMSVQNFLQKKYLPGLAKDTIVIQDHLAGELADVIFIDTARNHIAFYHAKGVGYKEKGKPKRPGGRKGDLEEVFAQSIGSARWIKSYDFAEELNRRLIERDATKVIRGEKKLPVFFKNYAPPLWSFSVVSAQPAIRSDKLSPAIRAMVASTQDYIASAGGSFELLCSKA